MEDDLILMLARIIASQDRPAGISQLADIIGREPAARLLARLDSGTFSNPPRDWKSLALAINLLRGCLGRNTISPAHPKRARHVFELYQGVDALFWNRVAGARILDFGAGIYSPTLNASFLYVNGADYVLAYEPAPLDELAAFFSRELNWSLADEPNSWVMSQMMSSGAQSRIDNLSRCNSLFDTYITRISHSASEVPVNFRSGRIDSLVSDLRGSFDLVISHSVLEHVIDFDCHIKALSELLRPGGVMVHIIDLADHRRNVKPYYGLGHLLNGGEDPSLNALRYCDMKNVFERNSLTVVSERLRRTQINKSLNENLLDRFRSYSAEDLCVVEAGVVLLKDV